MTLRADPNDARVTRIVATQRSRDYWASRDTGDVDAVTTWFGDLDPPTLQNLVTSLNQVIARVGGGSESMR